MTLPLCIDLFCGLGGWSEGFLAAGYWCVGFDIERHDYGGGGYPGDLVLQDVLTIHGSQFRDAAVIVASPPCQNYSYMAMPWSRAKQIVKEYRSGVRSIDELNALFNACFRIQREAIEAAGHFIPLIVENVRGAIPWVGQSKWRYGSFHLWGDVPALMPVTNQRKVPGMTSWDKYGEPGYKPQGFNVLAAQQYREGQKTANHANIRDGHTHTRHLTNPSESLGIKQSGISGVRENGKGDRRFQDGAARHGSKSESRKAASAQIAKIPPPLSYHIAKTYHPENWQA